jgi:large subunit ribosomal protein L5
MSRLQKKYQEQVRSQLQEKFGYTNVMLIPRLKKIVISMGLAEATKDKNAVQDAVKELTLLSGQKAILTYSKKSIANFKLRAGQVIGAKVTLRGQKMYEFLDRFSTIVTPRMRDFRGLTAKGDGQGSYSVGIDSQEIFPDIDIDSIKATRGMNITIVTSALNDKECIECLTLLGMPFKEESGEKK